MGFHLVFGESTAQGRGPRCNKTTHPARQSPWRQPGPQTSTWSHVAMQGTHIDVLPTVIWQGGPQASAWPQAEAPTTAINSQHRLHQHRPEGAVHEDSTVSNGTKSGSFS